jgi:uncharacterized OB-fold protein
MSKTYDKPLPEPFHEDISKLFWESTKNKRLIMPFCNNCSNIFFYPREACPYCSSMDLSWKEVSGRGKVYTYTWVRQAVHPSFQSEHGHIYAIVELEEGPKLPSNIVGCEPENVFVEMPVAAVYEKISEEYTLLKFEPA